VTLKFHHGFVARVQAPHAAIPGLLFTRGLLFCFHFFSHLDINKNEEREGVSLSKSGYVRAIVYPPFTSDRGDFTSCFFIG
jgi:hypothetical protein